MQTYPPFSHGRHRILPVAFSVLAVILALPGAARADDLTVDCSGLTPGAFTSITAAMTSLTPPPPGHINSITILSDCTENVYISGPRRLRFGAPPARTVKITNAVFRLTETLGGRRPRPCVGATAFCFWTRRAEANGTTWLNFAALMFPLLAQAGSADDLLI